VTGWKPILLLLLLIPFCQATAATKLYLRSAASPLGTLAAAGVGIGCYNGNNDYPWRVANTSSGTETSSTFAPTSTAPPCLVQTASGSGQYLRWISPPISSAFTLSGNIDYSAKCAESATQLNAGFRFRVYRWSVTAGGIVSTIHTSADSTECPTSAGTLTIAAAAPTSTPMSAGDRIVVEVEVRAIGSWGGNSTRTFSLYYEGANSFANFADSFTFSADGNNARARVQ